MGSREQQILKKGSVDNVQQYTISDLIKLDIIEKPMDGNHGGIHPKGDDFVSSGVPFVAASDINNGTLSFRTCKYIKQSQANQLRKGFAEEGDVLLTHGAVPDNSFGLSVWQCEKVV
ncbi:restriction endonuclease subunit S domain-containing protein [Pseudodesulfovibrio profundus]|uniref:hypothetical protein n=1 Tax=Pseudodesulfovibrio profundus TaxID=57320 RepID=UPI000BE2FDCD|nr:hypothetical protein [Pseudodesulfovibrio profundus]